MTPNVLIASIDKQITAIHRELRRLETIDLTSADSWQAAWDKHPDLRAAETGLFHQRGAAQAERDALVDKARRMAARRPMRFRKCPTCGSHTLRKAA